MPWIRQVALSDATGLLKKLFDQVQVYITVMKGKSPLSRAQQELLATVVSAELGCHY